VVAVAARSSIALSSEKWDMITTRLEDLAEYRQIVFMTASEAADRSPG
jgi:hypothetical protein